MGSKRTTKRVKGVVKVRSIRPGDGSKKRNQQSRTRSCGECNACCSAMAITELDKPEWTPCPHLNAARHRHPDDGQPSFVPITISREHLAAKGGGGCSIYRERPASCSGFKCQWLAGMPITEQRHRPDRSGLIIIDTPDPRSVQARELWPGAAAEGLGRDLVTALRRAQLEVIVVAPGAQKTLSPLTVFGSPVVRTIPNRAHSKRG